MEEIGENLDMDYTEEKDTESSEKPQMNIGVVILGLGILVILAALILKLTGWPGQLPVIGEYPTKIYTGDPYFSTHFFMGIITGLVVLIIGAAITFKSKIAPEESIEEEEGIFEEEEELEEGICPTCGAVIPITSSECPECGEELEPPEEEEEYKICTLCEAEIPLNAEECPECGEVFEVDEGASTVECPVCAAEVSSEQDKCPECGEPISEESDEDMDDLFADL